MPEKRYYGKYRATVLDNADPQAQGRLMLQVPDVLGDVPSSWALPCLPAVGDADGGLRAARDGQHGLGRVRAGDPGYPIWAGGYWGSAAEVPALALAAPPGMQNILLQTTGRTPC